MNTESKETWKYLSGFERAYKVSNLGNVISIKHKKHIELEPYIDAYGYKKVTLSHKGKTIKVRIHQAVYETFSGESVKDYIVRHKDTDKMNNSYTNLERITHKDHFYEHCTDQNNFTRKLCTEKVIEIKKMLLTGLYSIDQIADKFNVGRVTVSRIATGKAWSKVSVDLP